MAERRVAVTGIGVVSPCGIGVEAFWDGLLSEPPEGLRRIEDFDPAPYFDNPKEARRTDRFAQFALAAAAEALAQAGDIGGDPMRKGSWIGTGIGGLTTLEEQVLVNEHKGARRVSPFMVPMLMANAASAAVSMRYGWQGPCETTCTACAAGTQSIGNAYRLITSGRCDAVITGSSESTMTPTCIAGFTNMTAMSGSYTSRPFDKDRDGFVLAEGAGVLVLEEWEAARSRGATILGEIMGAASNADAHHITAPSPGGVGAIACMEMALADAGITPDQVGQVNAHGTSTPLNDAAEADAIGKVFGAPGPAVTSIKGVTGHSLGAAGALEAVATILSMGKGLIPPTAGYTTPDPDMAPIDLVVGEARPWEPAPTLSNSFGFGGHNGCIVIGPPTD
ncbi:beta-ketoacyl-[acyl-carrier-protein] synthase family protein [Rhabdothermincola salaria]|uniref:beta-ketoacyl-[acyl-carrier-protein] synthase family protein n=1 Tax=Rhabdothermincola salaria TaxID=2903142 RepID=UPI001E2DFBD2|nr:beta-ketoacyl-ACP synthase II [Rhabdothermincola salaria]MCD9622556.1 beta-ketoacyl-ACP synthase II [Rhabdothermincola salaria]